MKLKVILIACFILLFEVGAKAEGERYGSVEDIEWELVALDGEDLKSLNFKPSILLSSINDRMKGYAGCNNIIGSYKLGKLNRIKFVNSLSTMRACKENMGLEIKFLNLLERVTNFKRERQYLYFLDEDGQEILRFKN